MTSFETIIQNHFYINLDSRNDRLISCERELSKIGLERPRRFSAIKIADGRIGCSMSHLKCLETAKSEGSPYILICEDDIVIPKPNKVKNQVNRILQSGVSWDVLLLAGNSFKPHKLVSDDFIEVNRCYTTTAYIVKSSYYDTLINNIREGLKLLMTTGESEYTIDTTWFKLQQKDKFLLLNPPTIHQLEDYSDIEKTNVNYKDLMLNVDK